MTTTTRVTAIGAITGLLLTTLTLLAPAADAAWTTWVNRHGGKAQVCKVPLDGGSHRVKIRMDNRGAAHAHRLTLFRDRGGRITEIATRAGAGRISPVASIVLARGDQAGITTHEPNGGAAGDMVRLGTIARC